MTPFICVTCGTQFSPTEESPKRCPICKDERQYVGWEGQRWITLEALQREYKNLVKTEEPGLTSIVTEPTFAIGQRAFVVRGREGNILWDCLSLIDEATVEAVNALGGISAIAISHPHYYSSMVAWSRAFNAPIYLHAADREWVMHPDVAITFWEGETHALAEDLTLIRCGGHFEGGTVLYWQKGSEGVLLSGDILQVVPDRRYVSFMYSYPNLIPLPAFKVRRIVKALEPYTFARIYGAFSGRTVSKDAKTALARSAERYIAALGG